jgi:hypothetical protein
MTGLTSAATVGMDRVRHSVRIILRRQPAIAPIVQPRPVYPANFCQHPAIIAITPQKLPGHLPTPDLGRAFPKVL